MRYDKTQQILNNSDEYSDIFKNKNVKNIVQYSSFDFGKLRNINDYNIDNIIHTVQPFERLYMISQKYYNSPEYGWIICYTNNISNELEISIGTKLNIYFPIDRILELL